MELLEHCRGCARYLRSCSGMSKEVCEQHNLRIPITNADRIRAMSDEELAEFISPMAGCKTCPVGCGRYENNCIKIWLDWLKQEALP